MPLTRRHALQSLAVAGAGAFLTTAFPRHAQAAKKDPKWEAAIEKGLKWVAKTQSSIGHWTAGGNVGGSPMDFLTKFHDRTSSFHLKDRTTPEHGAKNLPWGTGETPIKEILQTVRKNKWKMPASIELEYDVPQDSDAVKEVARCLQYCKNALAS